MIVTLTFSQKCEAPRTLCVLAGDRDVKMEPSCILQFEIARLPLYSFLRFCTEHTLIIEVVYPGMIDLWAFSSNISQEKLDHK